MLPCAGSGARADGNGSRAQQVQGWSPGLTSASGWLRRAMGTGQGQVGVSHCPGRVGISQAGHSCAPTDLRQEVQCDSSPQAETGLQSHEPDGQASGTRRDATAPHKENFQPEGSCLLLEAARRVIVVCPLLGLEGQVTCSDIRTACVQHRPFPFNYTSTAKLLDANEGSIPANFLHME